MKNAKRVLVRRGMMGSIRSTDSGTGKGGEAAEGAARGTAGEL